MICNQLNDAVLDMKDIIVRRDHSRSVPGADAGGDCWISGAMDGGGVMGVQPDELFGKVAARTFSALESRPCAAPSCIPPRAVPPCSGAFAATSSAANANRRAEESAGGIDRRLTFGTGSANLHRRATVEVGARRPDAAQRRRGRGLFLLLRNVGEFWLG
jgi:hypothetical protein